MSKKRAYTYVRPCRDCKNDVTATFLITDKQALLVAVELNKPGAMLCKDCGLKAKEAEETQRLAEMDAKSDIASRMAEMKSAEIGTHICPDGQETPGLADFCSRVAPHGGQDGMTWSGGGWSIPPTTDHPLPLPDPAPAVPQAGSESEM